MSREVLGGDDQGGNCLPANDDRCATLLVIPPQRLSDQFTLGVGDDTTACVDDQATVGQVAPATDARATTLSRPVLEQRAGAIGWEERPHAREKQDALSRVELRARAYQFLPVAWEVVGIAEAPVEDFRSSEERR